MWLVSIFLQNWACTFSVSIREMLKRTKDAKTAGEKSGSIWQNQGAPWEKIWSVEPPSSVPVPAPTLSPYHRTWASDSSTVRQWQYKWTVLRLKHVWLKKLLSFFYLFHVTAPVLTGFSKKKCFLKQHQKLLQSGREAAFHQKGQRRRKKTKIPLLMLTEDLKTKPCWSVCVFFLLNVP